MSSRKFWKIVFLIVGGINVLGTLPGILYPQTGLSEFTGTITSEFYSLFLFRSLWIVVLLFGIGYLLVAFNPSKNHGILVIGGIGKLIFALHLLWAYGSHSFSSMALMTGVMDLVWVIIFSIFLFLYYQTRQLAF